MQRGGTDDYHRMTGRKIRGMDLANNWRESRMGWLMCCKYISSSGLDWLGIDEEFPFIEGPHLFVKNVAALALKHCTVHCSISPGSNYPP